MLFRLFQLNGPNWHSSPSKDAVLKRLCAQAWSLSVPSLKLVDRLHNKMLKHYAQAMAQELNKGLSNSAPATAWALVYFWEDPICWHHCKHLWFSGTSLPRYPTHRTPHVSTWVATTVWCRPHATAVTRSGLITWMTQSWKFFEKWPKIYLEPPDKIMLNPLKKIFGSPNLF